MMSDKFVFILYKGRLNVLCVCAGIGLIKKEYSMPSDLYKLFVLWQLTLCTISYRVSYKERGKRKRLCMINVFF